MGEKYIGDINDAEMDKWISDLRSGEYQQTRGYLQKGGGLCCLGVLALDECSMPDTVDGDNYGLLRDGRRLLFLPPAKSVDKLNLPGKYSKPGSSGSACVYVDPVPSELSEHIEGDVIAVSTLNDAYDLTFDQIADRLEETFLRKE